jgi:hypothetical protein
MPLKVSGSDILPLWLQGRLLDERLQPRIVRAVEHIPSSDHAIRKIQAWLAVCQSRYNCQEDNFSPPDRLIYVGRLEAPSLRLVLTDASHQSCRYVALSYCWGTSTSHVTTQGNLRSKMVSIKEDELPQTLQDAVYITRQLSLQYLWVDGLCIIQDNKQDWAQQSAKMGQYYNSSYLTLSASNSADAQHGFLHQRNLPSAVICGVVEIGKDDQREKVDVIASLTHASRDDALSCEPLTRRGWTLQERLLSCRIVHFTAAQLIWECRHTTELESGEIFAPSYSILKNPSTAVNTILELDNRYFRAWCDLVQQYSPYQLTKESDRLPALSGMASNFQRSIPSSGAYLAGHWEGHLPHTLIWDRGLHDHQDWACSRSRSPSWSWSSVNDQIDFLYNKTPTDPIAQIASFEVQSDEANPYGEVSYGRIDMIAQLIRAFSPRASRTPIYPRIWFFLDNGPHFFDGIASFDKTDIPDEFYLLVLVSWKPYSRGELQHGGILVAPSGSVEGEYKRIGAFSASRNTYKFPLPAPARLSLI